MFHLTCSWVTSGHVLVNEAERGKQENCRHTRVSISISLPRSQKIFSQRNTPVVGMGNIREAMILTVHLLE
jgi:hypothetical protein